MRKIPTIRSFYRVLSLWIQPTVIPSNPAKILENAGSTGLTLYVFERHSHTDHVALKIVCREHNLPDPDGRLQIGELRYASSTDVLKHRRRRLFSRSAFVPSDRFGQILAEISANEALDCMVVPVSVYWGQEPERQNSFWKVYFSEHWEIAGRTRKFFISLVHGRNTLLRLSEPILLRDFLEDAGTNKSEPSIARLERKLQRILRVHFRRRRRATLGPDLSHRRMLIQHVVADRDVRYEIKKQLDVRPGADSSAEQLHSNAHKYAEEIAADMSHRTVRLLHGVLKRLWTQLYDGVELNGMQQLDNLVEGHEIVYVPCHRSHIDYLLLSYILYANGYSLPHIAAGLNLNLPVVGAILRRGGAFFLRRSFAGNKLYAVVFNTYLKELVQRGHSLEYFIEGGRSRSGLLLPAKPGMLSMTVQAYLSEPVRPVIFVPVYFGYEKLIEGRSFTKELAGGKKSRESLLGLFKAFKTLREEYGRVYVNFADAIELDTLLDKHLADWRLSGPDLHPSSSIEKITASGNYRDLVTDLGRQVLVNINAAASVTAVSMVASLLLAAPGRASGRKELEEQLRLTHQLLSTLYESNLMEKKGRAPASQPSGLSASIVLPELQPAVWIDQTVKLGFLQEEESELGGIVRIKPKQMTSLMYFRNNILHLFVIPSLVACVLTQQRSASKAWLNRLIQQAWPVLSAQYFLDQELSSEIAVNTLAAMEQNGLLDADGNKVVRPSSRSLQSVLLIRMATLIRPTIERSYLAAALLGEFRTGIAVREYEQYYRVAAHRFALTEARDPNELYNKASFQTLVDSLLATDAVEELDDKLCANSVLQSLELEIRPVLPDATRHAMLAAAQLAARQSVV